MKDKEVHDITSPQKKDWLEIYDNDIENNFNSPFLLSQEKKNLVVLTEGQKHEIELHIEGELDALSKLGEKKHETELSRVKKRREVAWKTLKKAIKHNQTITGIASGKIIGGYIVELGDIRAFLPGSLVHEQSFSEGKELILKLVKLDQSHNNVVVSHIAAVDEENAKDNIEILSLVQELKKIDKSIIQSIKNQNRSHAKYMNTFNEKIIQINGSL